MTPAAEVWVAGLDVGTTCVKAVVLDGAGRAAGRGLVPARGYFEDCALEALEQALADAGIGQDDLALLCATGFGAARVPGEALRVPAGASLARGAFHHMRGPATVLDLGGQGPRLVRVSAAGEEEENRSARKCAIGTGTFLAEAARQLDIHPSRFEELAATGSKPARIGSYCSVFAVQQILEALREGRPREDVALGCYHSVVERILEMGELAAPVVAAGGIVEYYPGVLKLLAQETGLEIQPLPEPILVTALGAALTARAALQEGRRTP